MNQSHLICRPLFRALLAGIFLLSAFAWAAPSAKPNILFIYLGENQKIRDWLHFEHAKCYSEEQAFHALTDGEWKYIWRPNSGREHLFNLVQDPLEERDLSKVAVHANKRLEWRTKLINRLKNRPEKFVQNGKLIAGRTYEPLNAGTLSRQSSTKRNRA